MISTKKIQPWQKLLVQLSLINKSLKSYATEEENSGLFPNILYVKVVFMTCKHSTTSLYALYACISSPFVRLQTILCYSFQQQEETSQFQNKLI